MRLVLIAVFITACRAFGYGGYQQNALPAYDPKIPGLAPPNINTQYQNTSNYYGATQNYPQPPLAQPQYPQTPYPQTPYPPAPYPPAPYQNGSVAPYGQTPANGPFTLNDYGGTAYGAGDIMTRNYQFNPDLITSKVYGATQYGIDGTYLEDYKMYEKYPAFQARYPPQFATFSPKRDETLVLTISFKKGTSSRLLREAAAVIIQAMQSCDLSSEGEFAVGFGQQMWRKIMKGDYNYEPIPNFQSGDYDGWFPVRGDDAVIYGKACQKWILFEVARSVSYALEHTFSDIVEQIVDRYGFKYRNFRDMTGFKDGIVNAVTAKERFEWAIDRNTGGSFLNFQVWIHKPEVIDNAQNSRMEGYVGRYRGDGKIIKNLTPPSHIVKVSGYDLPKGLVPSLRQSSPYGSVTGEFGLLYLGFSRDVKVVDWYCGSMSGKWGPVDDIFKLSYCSQMDTFFMPSLAHLQAIVERSRIPPNRYYNRLQCVASGEYYKKGSNYRGPGYNPGNTTRPY